MFIVQIITSIIALVLFAVLYELHCIRLFLEKRYSDASDMASGETDEMGDYLFDEAVRLAEEHKKISTSMLQRKFKIGYARAARLIDIMEDQGVLEKGDGAMHLVAQHQTKE